MPALQELPAPHVELVNYIHDHPEKKMVDIMEPYRKYEAQLRSVFAQDRKNPALDDPYINLVPLFNENTKNIKTRARFLAAESQEEKDRYIMALPDDKRRPNGSPAVVSSLKVCIENRLFQPVVLMTLQKGFPQELQHLLRVVPCRLELG